MKGQPPPPPGSLTGEIHGTGRADLKTAHARTYNLRDYGGYAVAGGGRLCRGKLLRSAQLDDALPEDAGLLTRLGVETVVDLRGAHEVGRTPPPAYDGFSGKIDFATLPDAIVPHALGNIERTDTPAGVHAQVREVYGNLPGSGRFRESLAQYFATLASETGPTLIHCFAGKDRTGLAVALFQRVAGVHADDVMSEYLLTNAMGAERIAMGARVLRSQAKTPMPDWRIEAVLGVRAEYLDSALAAIAADHATPMAYVAHVTGYDADRITGIVARWLD